MAYSFCGAVPNGIHGDQVVLDHLTHRACLAPTCLRKVHPDLLEFYEPGHAIHGPVVVFIGDPKPHLACAEIEDIRRGQARMRCAT